MHSLSYVYHVSRIAGWKQKEHPVLYNALHIGDQLLSIAGVSISSAAEANKIIRNTNTLFVSNFYIPYIYIEYKVGRENEKKKRM